MSAQELMREALARIEELQARLRAAEAPQREPIAVVGIGCRYPGAPGVQAFWELLRDGVDAVSEVPASRWDVNAYYDPDPDAPGKIYTRHGGWLDGIELFDAAFFGMSPREAMSLDPQQRLLLESTWEALEHAGIPADSLSGSNGGVFIGIGGVDYYQRLAARSPDAIDAYMASGNAHSTASGRLSYVLGLQGPSVSIDTACSSSLVATHLACRSLRQRECDVAVAGGVSVILSPAIHLNHCRSKMLAADGRCKAFDAAADGFIRSEGCGIVVLKRLSDAQRDGNRILAVIRGSAVNQDGRTSALTVPNGRSQQAVIRAALADAGVEPSQISYVEAHGTGTALGDPIEAQALGAVFAGRKEPLAIGSVKANIGHAEAAAGVAGLIKVVLAMQRRELPPQLHFEQPNPRVDWSRLPLRVPTTRTPWAPNEAIVRAGVSSFGFGGTNAHLVVESAPVEVAAHTAPIGAAAEAPLLVLSAKSAEALAAVARRYRTAFAEAESPAPLAAMCAEAALGRSHMPVRAVVAAGSVEETASSLEAIVAGRRGAGVWQGSGGDPDRSVAFIYPGQGALRWGMGRALYETNAAYRAAIDRCAAALAGEWSAPLTEVLYGERGKSLIGRTEYAQAALFATEYALTEWWASLGIRPAGVIGHSVGEFAAARAAGVLTVEEACRLLVARGRLMQPLGGRMAVIAAAEPRVRELIAPYSGVEIAALNGRRQVVVSGAREQVDAVIEAASAAGVAAKPLSGDVAFHSALMTPMLAEWERIAAAVPGSEAQCDWVSTVTGREVTRADAAYWSTQVRQPVLFAAAASRLWALGHRVWIEVGPSAALASLASEVAGESVADGVWVGGLRADRADWTMLREAVAQVYVAGMRIDWTGWFGERPARVALPTYPFERTRYWIDAPAAAPASAAASTATSADASPAPAYSVEWVDAPAPRARTSGAWVVRGGRPETSVAVAAELERQGAHVTSSLASASAPAGVVYAGALDLAAAPGGTSARDIEDTIARAFIELRDVLRECAAVPGARLWVVTRGAAALPGDRDVNAAQAALWGVATVAALEHPDTWGGVIDLDPRAGGVTGIDALLAGRDDDRLAVRDGGVRVPRLRPHPLPRTAPSVRADASYLITGGLGALGLEVAGRLAGRGARRIVLVGRSAPGAAATKQIEALRAGGVEVRIESADVTRLDQMQAVLDRIAASGHALRGVVHAAGANGNEPFETLSEASLRAVLAAKVSGAWVLHELTRSLPLDFFVGFSSIASVWGSKGQAHYAAANAYLDALVSHRLGQGLPALSLQWGPWAAGGMATADAQQWLERVGVRAMPSAAALDAFESALGSNGRFVVADIAWPRFLEVYESRRAQPFFANVAAGIAARAGGTASASPRIGHAAAIAALGPEAGRQALLGLVRDHVVAVLNLDPRRAPAPHQGFFTFGFDSLLALELRNRLAADLDAPLPSTLAFDYPNIRALAEYLAREVVRLDDRAETGLEETPALAGDLDESIASTLARLDRLMGKR